MTVKVLTEHHFELLSLRGGCTASSESIHVKLPHCWKSHVTAHLFYVQVANHGVSLFVCFVALRPKSTAMVKPWCN